MPAPATKGLIFDEAHPAGILPASLPASASSPAVPVEVQTFESPFGKARVVIFSDGSKWFVAKDVCEGLGIAKDVSAVCARLKPEQKQVLSRKPLSRGLAFFDTLFPGSTPRLILISRGGYNDLILESRKPLARDYRQWVTDTVLPSLQDTGTFTDPGGAASMNHPVADVTVPGRA